MEAQIILKIIFISTFKGVKHLKFDLLYFVIFNQVKRLSLVWGEEVKNVGPVRLFAFFFSIPATLESVYVHTHVCE